jgi:hypothetical protein
LEKTVSRWLSRSPRANLQPMVLNNNPKIQRERGFPNPDDAKANALANWSPNESYSMPEHAPSTGPATAVPPSDPEETPLPGSSLQVWLWRMTSSYSEGRLACALRKHYMYRRNRLLKPCYNNPARCEVFIKGSSKV